MNSKVPARRLETQDRAPGDRVADPHEVRKLDRELAVRRTKLMKELRVGIAALEKEVRSIGDHRATMWERLNIAFDARMLARHAYR